MNLFSLGYLPLDQAVIAMRTPYWAICRKIEKLARELDFYPEELEGIDATLSDTYFCNFSLFQSMPGQLGDQAVVPDHAHSCWKKSRRSTQFLATSRAIRDGKVDPFHPDRHAT